jgi:hypothetical protein
MKAFLLALILLSLVLLAGLAEAQTRRFTIAGGICDGGKFAARYKLNPKTDWWFEGNVLVLKDGVTMPDTPPICEASNSAATVSRDKAKAEIDKDKAVRAVVLLTLDELNAHALKIKEILDAVDAATNLADLKTRVALISDYPQRTSAQLITAIKNKIDSGDAD